MKTKLYDSVKQILIDNPKTRDSDKELVWQLWGRYRTAITGYMNRDEFINAPSSDSITRAARMIKAKHEELRGTKEVLEFKWKKQLEKGTFVYRETLF